MSIYSIDSQVLSDEVFDLQADSPVEITPPKQSRMGEFFIRSVSGNQMIVWGRQKVAPNQATGEGFRKLAPSSEDLQMVFSLPSPVFLLAVAEAARVYVIWYH